MTRNKTLLILTVIAILAVAAYAGAFDDFAAGIRDGLHGTSTAGSPR